MMLNSPEIFDMLFQDFWRGEKIDCHFRRYLFQMLTYKITVKRDWGQSKGQFSIIQWYHF